jgi:hypothetical protein
MEKAGPVIAEAGGLFDVVALGEWIHAGDVREALGEPDAYAGPGLELALTLMVLTSQQGNGIPVHADLDGRDEPLILDLPPGDRTPARFIGDATTLVRLSAGRPVIGVRYELAGAKAAELNLFGG